MSRETVDIQARSNADPKLHVLEDGGTDKRPGAARAPVPEDLLNDIAAGVGSHSDSLVFSAGVFVLCALIYLIAYAPALCPLAFLAFAAVCLPYRVASFAARKWAFFLLDFCYVANLACCAFLLLRPEDAGLEAAVYVLCEGPLASALLAWQCAWLLGSPDHVISVLVHLLPGLALFCHRFLAHTRQPLVLLAQLAQALLATDPRVATSADPDAAAAVRLDRFAAAVAAARGRVPCAAALVAAAPKAAAAAARAAAGGEGICAAALGDDGGGDWMGANLAARAAEAVAAGHPCVDCYIAPPGRSPPSCPSPAWLWLGAAPLGFYLAWQLGYFLLVQVALRRFILARNYDTSYRVLARRAQRANSALNRLVRRGGVARRLLMYGLLQLLYTIVTQAFAVVTYHSFGAAASWQLVKFAVPLYLGACHQCQRLPAQQLRSAAARLVAAGMLAPEVLAPSRSAPRAGRTGLAGRAAASTAKDSGGGASKGRTAEPAAD